MLIGVISDERGYAGGDGAPTCYGETRPADDRAPDYAFDTVLWEEREGERKDGGRGGRGRGRREGRRKERNNEGKARMGMRGREEGEGRRRRKGVKVKEEGREGAIDHKQVADLTTVSQSYLPE